MGPDGFLCACKRADLLAVGPRDKSLLDVDVLANVFYSLLPRESLRATGMSLPPLEVVEGLLDVLEGQQLFGIRTKNVTVTKLELLPPGPIPTIDPTLSQARRRSTTITLTPTRRRRRRKTPAASWTLLCA